jgi:tRNA threonylcarbamoyladenosine biosynthesis protein TsaB
LTVLGIETSDDFVGVGIADKSGVIMSKAANSSRRNKNLLHELLDTALEMANKTFEDLDGVAVSLGPGSFTGLRVGLAAAKGICWSKNKSLAGVPSTEVIMGSVTAPKGKFIAVKDARRSEYYFGGFEGDGSTYSRILPDATCTAGQISEFVSQGFKVIGRKDQLRETDLSPDKIIEYDPSELGGILAVMGRNRLIDGEKLDISSASPQYVRDPGIGKVAN